MHSSSTNPSCAKWKARSHIHSARDRLIPSAINSNCLILTVVMPAEAGTQVTVHEFADNCLGTRLRGCDDGERDESQTSPLGTIPLKPPPRRETPS
jgi:hypothetical protein